jgi:hypothetical protein
MLLDLSKLEQKVIGFTNLLILVTIERESRTQASRRAPPVDASIFANRAAQNSFARWEIYLLQRRSTFKNRSLFFTLCQAVLPEEIGNVDFKRNTASILK